MVLQPINPNNINNNNSLYTTTISNIKSYSEEGREIPHVVETIKEARTILLSYFPKEHLRRFHGMDDVKEIWEAIRTRFGGNAKSKKMHKAVLKQQFKRDSFYQHQEAGKQEKNQMGLLTMDDGIVNLGRTY
ncbi:hypothetical protein Tco_0262443 [Tanacetum coccineum]